MPALHAVQEYTASPGHGGLETRDRRVVDGVGIGALEEMYLHARRRALHNGPEVNASVVFQHLAQRGEIEVPSVAPIAASQICRHPLRDAVVKPGTLKGCDGVLTQCELFTQHPHHVEHLPCGAREFTGRRGCVDDPDVSEPVSVFASSDFASASTSAAAALKVYGGGNPCESPCIRRSTKMTPQSERNRTRRFATVPQFRPAPKIPWRAISPLFGTALRVSDQRMSKSRAHVDSVCGLSAPILIFWPIDPQEIHVVAEKGLRVPSWILVRGKKEVVQVRRLSLLLGLVLLPLLPARTVQAQAANLVPVTLDGETVRLEIRIYRPATDGPVPTLVYNHGSTGHGRDPSLFTRPITSTILAQFMVQRGWALVLPARRGRGGSEGLYDEGFATDRTPGYTCDPSASIPGADRALRDIAAAMQAILAMPFVNRDRVMIGGVSRGGVLSVAYAGQNPEQVKGVINFVGGWLGTGCATASLVNQTLFRRGGRYPGETIWLYGDRDPFYPLSHSRENFAAFQAAGGKGTFHEFAPPPGSDGHNIGAFPALWTSVVEAYLNR